MLATRQPARQAMAIGTAGYTAMLAVMRLEDAGLEPDAGPLLVTGAMGGVGSIAIVVIGREGQGPAAINPFYYSLLGSTCAAAAERGYEALVSFQAQQDEFFGHYVARRQADGVVVILTGAQGRFSAGADLKRGFPTDRRIEEVLEVNGATRYFDVAYQPLNEEETWNKVVV